MGKYYTPPKKTGKEYVLVVDDLHSTTVFRCSKLPRDWKDYILDPLVRVSEEIQQRVHGANKVPIRPDKMDDNDLLSSYKERATYLMEALRLFETFDTRFDLLMKNIDIEGYEVARIKKILLNIIKKIEAEKGVTINLETHVGLQDIQYVAANNKTTMKLMFTPKNCKNWLRKRHEAEQEVSKKLSKDLAYISNLRNKLA